MNDRKDALNQAARPGVLVGNQGAYTLVETMMALAISGFLIAGIGSVLNGQQKAYGLQEQIVEVQEGLRIAATLMSQEIRTAGYDPTGTASAGIRSADAGSIHFTRDLDGNGDTTGSNEDISYQTYPSKGVKVLGRKSGGAAKPNNPVLERIENLAFVYRKADGALLSTPVADPGQIKKIEIVLTASTARPDPIYPKNGGYRTRELKTTVSLRN